MGDPEYDLISRSLPIPQVRYPTATIGCCI